MALVALRRSLCRLPDFRVRRAVTLRRRLGSPVASRRPRAPPPGPLRVGLHRAYGHRFLSEDGSALGPAGEPHCPGLGPWDGAGGSREGEDGPVPPRAPGEEQVHLRTLDGLASAEDVLAFVNALDPLPDSVAARALERLGEVGGRGGGPGSPATWPPCSASLMAALRTLVLLRADPRGSLLGRLLAECLRRLAGGDLRVRELCVLGESLLALRGPGCEALTRVLQQLQGADEADWGPDDVVAVYGVLQACPEQAGLQQGLLARLARVALPLVPQLGPASVSRLLAALAGLDQAQARPLLCRLARHAVRLVPHFTAPELGRVLDALAHFGHHDRVFTHALERHAAGLGTGLAPEVGSSVAEFCGRELLLSRPVLDAVAGTLVGRLEEFSPAQISKVIEAFGKLNYVPPNAAALFAKLETRLWAQLNSFPPKALLKLLHSCSLIEYHPVNFMPKVFSPFFLQRLQGEESCLDRVSLAQLTQLFLSSVLECPFYKGPKLLPKYRVKSFLTPCCSLESPVDFRLYKSVMLGLIDLLGARLYFASKVLTPYCYTLDVEIKLDEGGFVLPASVDEDVYKRVALCIDGPQRFCSNGRHLLGKEAIKQRHLQLLGYRVVQVPYYEVELLRSRLQVVEYLQRKLFSQDTAACW